MENLDLNLIDEEYREVVFDLLFALKNHSKESYIHSIDVAEKAMFLAVAFKIKGAELKKLYVASLLHDIGKLCIDGDLLHKTDVSNEERELIQMGHIEGTRNILENYFEKDIVRLAAHHHERLDCSGYPEHLNERELGVLDRILQVADVTSALSMNRCYQDARSPEEVVAILEDLIRHHELDEKCVKEIEKIFLIPHKNPKQPIPN